MSGNASAYVNVGRLAAWTLVVYWFALVAGLGVYSALHAGNADELAALWSGVLLGTALGNGCALRGVRAWFVALILVSIGVLVAPFTITNGDVLFWLAFIPASFCGWASLSDRGSLFAFWFPAVIWMLSILDHGGRVTALALDGSAAALLGGLAFVFIAFLHARESRRIQMWRTIAPTPLAPTSAPRVLKEVPRLRLGMTGWGILVSTSAFAITAWLAPKLWHVEPLVPELHVLSTASAGDAHGGVHTGAVATRRLPCCRAMAGVETKRKRVKEYFDLGRGHTDEHDELSEVWQGECVICTADGVPIGAHGGPRVAVGDGTSPWNGPLVPCDDGDGVLVDETTGRVTDRAGTPCYRTGPGYGTPGYGTPGYGTPGYGTPGYATPGYGTSVDGVPDDSSQSHDTAAGIDRPYEPRGYEPTHADDPGYQPPPSAQADTPPGYRPQPSPPPSSRSYRPQPSPPQRADRPPSSYRPQPSPPQHADTPPAYQPPPSPPQQADTPRPSPPQHADQPRTFHSEPSPPQWPRLRMPSPDDRPPASPDEPPDSPQVDEPAVEPPPVHAQPGTAPPVDADKIAVPSTTHVERRGSGNDGGPPFGAWLIAALAGALALQLLVLAVRPVRRAVTLRHLRKPFWNETVDQRVSNWWHLVLVGLRDAGWRSTSGEGPRELAKRLDIEGVERAATILERARHGIGIDAADLVAMGEAAETAYRASRERATGFQRFLGWFRRPLV